MKKTKNELKQQSASTYPTNGKGDITAEAVRAFNDDLLDSVAMDDGSGGVPEGVLVNNSNSGGLAVGKYANTDPHGVAVGGVDAGNRCFAGENSVGIGDGVYTDEEAVAVGRNGFASHMCTSLGGRTCASNDNSTVIGYGAHDDDNDQVVLGNSQISALKCAAPLTVTSDRRDKTDIEEMNADLANKIILALKPVEFKRNPRGAYGVVGDYTRKVRKPVKDEQGNITGFTEDKVLVHGEMPLFDETGNAVNFDKKAHAKGTKKGGRTHVGFIAQDVQKLLIDLTGGDKYGALVSDLSRTKESVTEEGRQMGLAYENFIPMMISVIQQQQKQIDELTAKMAVSSGQ